MPSRPPELALDRAEHVEGRQLRRRDGLLDRQLAADLAELRAPALAVGRPVTCDVRDVAVAHEPPVGEPHARRDHLRRRISRPRSASRSATPIRRLGGGTRLATLPML